MRELLSLEDIYNKKIFRIPDYQRGYAWGKKQLIDFWEDLISLGGDRLHYTGVLSIKTVPKEKWLDWNDERWLIEKRRYEPYFVVDGQQRLTTTSIFLQCLVEEVKKLPKNKAQNNSDILLGSYPLNEIIENFIVISQPPHYTINSYRFGYEVDNPSFDFLRHRIFNEPYSGTIDETFYTLNLENAKKFFQENIKEIVAEKGETILEELYEKLTQRFRFNLYEISDDFDVFVAFETMNNRGKQLSDLELLKNRLIYLTTLYNESEVNENDKIKVRQNINDAWKEIYFQLGRNKNRPLNDDDFLRAHWIMYFKYSRKKGNDYIRYLLDEQFTPKLVLEKVKIRTESITAIEELTDITTEDDDNLEEESSNGFEMQARLPIKDTNTYVLSLKESARHWYNTFNPEHNPDLPIEERLWLDKLNRIGMGYFRPLIMASYCNKDITSEGRLVIFKALERFIFIVFRLSRAMSNYRNSSFYNIARELFYGRQNVDHVINTIERDLAWTFNKDGSFKYSYFKDYIDRKFSSRGLGFYSWNGLKYFLFEYEEELKKQRNQQKISWKNFITNEKDRVSVEHIYPQTATMECWEKAYKQFSEDEKKYLNGSLGNLLPLSSSVNSSLQNDCFVDKKRTIRNEDNELIRNGYSNGSFSEQEVAIEEVWTSEQIKNRGLKLLQFLETRWNIILGSKEKKLDLLHLNFLSSESEEKRLTP